MEVLKKRERFAVMIRKSLLLAIVLATMLSPAARAGVPVTVTQKITGPFFLCANVDFTLQQFGNDYVLQGPYNVPTPGYTFEFSNIHVENERLVGAVTLKAPDLPEKKLFTPALRLSYAFRVEQPFKSVSIDIVKPFNWGDTHIACAKSGR